jgi:cytochrome c biogenesis protein CcdA
MREIYHNATNLEKFTVMNSQYGIENSGIPTIFIGADALVGDINIKDHFEEKILEEKQRLLSCNITSPNSTAVISKGCLPSASTLTIQLVIISALIDSINPCGLSVLIFLLISISAIANTRRILLIGGTYIAAVFIFHLFTGIGLFSFISLSGFSKGLSLLGAAIAIVLGIITLSDVLRNREEFLLSIPESKKSVIGHYVRAASFPAAFVLGILSGLFGFSCTGGIYISILGLMGREFSLMSGLPYLVLYNTVFVIPLVLVLILAAYGIPMEHANTLKIRYRRILRIIVGMAMIALGIIIFSGWLG